VILCAASIFLIHPVLYFLKYFAAFGLIIGLLLLVYILKTDEL
jgi:presenilin-like A22 family membrane protease